MSAHPSLCILGLAWWDRDENNGVAGDVVSPSRVVVDVGPELWVERLPGVGSECSDVWMA